MFSESETRVPYMSESIWKNDLTFFFSLNLSMSEKLGKLGTSSTRSFHYMTHILRDGKGKILVKWAIFVSIVMLSRSGVIPLVLAKKNRSFMPQFLDTFRAISFSRLFLLSYSIFHSSMFFTANSNIRIVSTFFSFFWANKWKKWQQETRKKIFKAKLWNCIRTKIQTRCAPSSF